MQWQPPPLPSPPASTPNQTRQHQQSCGEEESPGLQQSSSQYESVRVWEADRVTGWHMTVTRPGQGNNSSDETSIIFKLSTSRQWENYSSNRLGTTPRKPFANLWSLLTLTLQKHILIKMRKLFCYSRNFTNAIHVVTAIWNWHQTFCKSFNFFCLGKLYFHDHII